MSEHTRGSRLVPLLTWTFGLGMVIPAVIAQTPRPAVFLEVARQAGIAGFTLGNAHGAVFVDFNNDGFLDLCFTVKEYRNYLYVNNGDGTFQEIAETAGLNTCAGDKIRGVTVADYDNDGDPDLYFCAGEDDALYRNDGNLTFTEVTDAAGVREHGNGLAATWGDYDRDGWVDLYVANWDESRHTLYHNQGNGSFVEATPSAGLGQDAFNNIGLWVDYDNDGDDDLFVSRWNDQPHRLWRNNGNGTFTNVAATAGVANTFKGQGAAVADYDNDGDFDIYLASDAGANMLFHNNGDGTFREVARAAGVDDARRSVDCAWGDFNHDGWVDLFVGNYDAPNALYLNNGNGTFTENSGITADPERTIGTTVGDYNNDGRLDFYTANSETPGKLYCNQTDGRRWLKVALQGVTSNRSGIGARLELVVQGQRRVQMVSGGSGYCSQNAPIVFFGMAEAGSADRLIVRWPSGTVDLVDNVSTGQTLLVVEGKGPQPYAVPPVISQVQVSMIAATSAVITWQTDVPCDGQVLYGLHEAGAESTAINSELSHSHRHTLPGLIPDTVYFFRVRSSDAGGRTVESSGSFHTLPVTAALPEHLTLFPVHPNPVAHGCTFRLVLPEPGLVRLLLHDLTGRELAMLYEGELEAGTHAIWWQQFGAARARLPSGVHLVQVVLTASSGRREVAQQKLVLLK